MTQPTYPHYHSLTHKFILAGKDDLACLVNIDEVQVVRPIIHETEEVTEYGIILYFRNGTEVHSIYENADSVKASMAAFYNLLMVVRNPSIDLMEEKAPFLPTISWSKSKPLIELPDPKSVVKESLTAEPQPEPVVE